MKWTRGYQSQDVEDNRGRSFGGGGTGMAGLALSIGSRFGLPGILIALAAVFVLPRFLDGEARSLAPQQEGSGEKAPADEAAQFVSFVFDDAQRVWTQEFSRSGRNYQKAKLVLFSGRTPSACGVNSSAVGPFYCPPDSKVYIDLSFYDELSRRFGAPGDFAQAYVIAHEVGHHVQNLLGIERQVRQADGPSTGENSAAVRLELQADCFAGIWAHSTRRRELLEAGDIDEGLAAAAAVGDDRLQKQATGSVHPESWTHGSAAQRATWFKRGLENGKLDACDTFSAGR